MSIRETYEAFIRDNNREPVYACPVIRWKDDDTVEEVFIKLSCDVGENDDEIFYYVNGINEIEALTDKDNGEDFYIIENSIIFI